MDKNRKREIAREYREREKTQGIYAVRCTPTGEVWVGSSRNPDKQQNTTWFQLRLGGHPNKALQAAWNNHGDAAFTYELLEDVKDENPLLIDSVLKDRDTHWRKELGAERIVG